VTQYDVTAHTQTPLVIDDNTPMVSQLRELGITAFTEVQQAVIPPVLAGASLLVSAPTGSGKTLAYLLPLLQQLQARSGTGIGALIVAPTRELVRQITGLARTLCDKQTLNVVAITGGDKNQKIQRQLLAEAQVVVATPGRLTELVSAGEVAVDQLRFLVLDEADRALAMGLQADVFKLASALPAERQTLLLSATLQAPGLENLVTQLVPGGQVQRIHLEPANDNREHEILLADDLAHKCQLLPALLASRSFERALIFANTRDRVETLSHVLDKAGLPCAYLHGDLDTARRKQVLQRFIRGHVAILLATDVAARGLDVAGMDLVINADMPFNVPAFVHRAGRTGRMGQQGRVVSLVTAQSWNLMVEVQQHLGVSARILVLAGLQGHYQGPKKLKSSGKAAGKKKKTTEKDKQKKTEVAKPKQRHRERKNIGKRRQPVAQRQETSDD